LAEEVHKPKKHFLANSVAVTLGTTAILENILSQTIVNLKRASINGRM
jgi:hypothetical protein